MSVALSVVVCSHNPRPDYLQRTLESLRVQTLGPSEWEFLLVDNNSSPGLAGHWSIDWHPRARHVREEKSGLIHARLRAIAESNGATLVFVDDDNVLAPDYLERANALRQANAHLGTFGAGALEPEFELTPPPQVQPWLPMLALRTVLEPHVGANWTEKACIPWGAGLCVSRNVAAAFVNRVTHLDISSFGRRGEQLFCAEDDLFSFVACEQGLSFGIFPELRITHLIASRRLSPEYILRLVHGHAYSHTVLNYLLCGEPADTTRHLVRTLLHGLRRGRFPMQCRTAQARGRRDAANFIRDRELRPIQSHSPNLARSL